MGLFDIFNKKKENQPIIQQNNTLATNITPSTSKIDLRKKTLSVSLEKKNMQNTKARVAVVLDDSGSMSGLYRNGTVQDVVERLLPVALKLDDNSELDVWIFDDSFKRMKSVTEKDFSNYVDRVVMKEITWGSTKYAPVMKDIIKKYTKEDKSDIPTFIIFITDGDNNSSDKVPTKETIIEASKYNIFWQFVGIGNSNFDFLNDLDTMEGRVVDNANFIKIVDINKTTDMQLYDMLVNEYPSWESEAKKIGIVK